MQITAWILIWPVFECRYDDLDRASEDDGRGGQQLECAGGRRASAFALCSVVGGRAPSGRAARGGVQGERARGSQR